MSSYPERIRAGLIAPWIGAGVAGALASARAASDELDTLDRGDPRRDAIAAQEQAWRDVADTWACAQERGEVTPWRGS